MPSETDAIFKKLDIHSEEIRRLKSLADMHEKEIERIYRESKEDRERFNQLHGELKTDIHGVRDLLVEYNKGMEKRYAGLSARVSNNEGFWAAMKWALPLFLTLLIAFGGVFAWIYANKPPAQFTTTSYLPAAKVQPQYRSDSETPLFQRGSLHHTRHCGDGLGIAELFYCSLPFDPSPRQLSNGVFLAVNTRNPDFGTLYSPYQLTH